MQAEPAGCQATLAARARAARERAAREAAPAAAAARGRPAADPAPARAAASSARRSTRRSSSQFGYALPPDPALLAAARRHRLRAPLRHPGATPRPTATSSAPGWSSGGYGNRIVVDHGIVSGIDLATTYNHLTSFVRGSGHVSRGQLIGYSGTTGLSTGCHLHFETCQNGVPVNPRTWF